MLSEEKPYHGHQLERFPLFVNRGDSLRGANKILWPSPTLRGLQWGIRAICGFE
jgi:hypothetical protein